MHGLAGLCTSASIRRAHPHQSALQNDTCVCVHSVVSERVREIDTEDDGRAALVKGGGG